MTDEEIFSLIKSIDPSAVRLPPGIKAIVEKLDSIYRNEIESLRTKLAEAEKAQLTTPPVLRWEGVQLLCGNYPLAEIGIGANKLFYYVIEDIEATQGYRNTIDEARRAAEKALGIPFEVEEV